MQFQLTITMGNDAMQSGEDIARALRKLASTLDRVDVVESYYPSGPIKDDNGNKVGEWEIT